MRGQVASFAHDGHLIIADADNFKRLNDTFGHLFGDKALVLISGSFRGATLSRGIAARIGGEEFGVFLPGTSLDEARTVAELIRKSVEASELVHETGHVALSVSLGLTPVTKGDTLSEAMKRADDALYAAKQAGKNRVAVFDSALPADGKRAA